MEKFKVVVGIGMMIVVTIPLVMEIVSIGEAESSRLPQCFPRDSSKDRYIIPPEPCNDFTSDYEHILFYAGVFGVGLWLLIFGINEMSLNFFSKK